MPTVTVKTYPVKGNVKIFRINMYGILSEGEAPVRAFREYAFPYLVSLFPVDRNGILWVPEVFEERGMAEGDIVLNYKYIPKGRVEDYL